MLQKIILRIFFKIKITFFRLVIIFIHKKNECVFSLIQKIMVNEILNNLFNSLGADQAVGTEVGSEEKFSHQAIKLFITLFENMLLICAK